MLSDAINAFAKLNEEMGRQVLENDGSKALDLAKARVDLAGRLKAIVDAGRNDAALRADAAKAAVFDEKLFAIRKALAEHQAKWRADSIAADVAAYRASTRNISSLNNDFIDWTRRQGLA